MHGETFTGDGIEACHAGKMMKRLSESDDNEGSDTEEDEWLPVIIGGPEESTEKNVIEQRKDKESKSKKCDICSHQWIADIGRGILQNCHSQHSHHDQKEKRN